MVRLHKLLADQDGVDRLGVLFTKTRRGQVFLAIVWSTEKAGLRQTLLLMDGRSKDEDFWKRAWSSVMKCMWI